ncbi:MAG: hypothetical protein N2422_10160 [Rhodobacteraceae bacterium]|nr:hypothetical protein [Paracoccaceae bacterium]
MRRLMVKWLFVLCIGLAVWLGSMMVGGGGGSFKSSGGFGFSAASSIGSSAAGLARKVRFWN